MKLGITWGGQPSWVKAGATDRPHFEVSANWTMPKGYKLEGQVIVPSNSKMKVQLIVDDKKNKEPIKEVNPMFLLNETGRKEIRALLKKARSQMYTPQGASKPQPLIDPKIHTDEKINAYADDELLSYQAAIINRTFGK